jgi:hypothetical protein
MSQLQTSRVVRLGLLITLACAANQRAVAQRGDRADDEQVAENRTSEQPKAMIALSIWILKLSESHEDADLGVNSKAGGSSAKSFARRRVRERSS